MIRYTAVVGRNALVFASPMPTPYRSLLTILQPLGATVWVAIALSLIVYSFALWFVTKAEVSVDPLQKDWKSLLDAAWYVFVIAAQESITRNVKPLGKSASL